MSDASREAAAPAPISRFCPALRLTELEVLRKGREWGRLELELECMWLAPGLAPTTFKSSVWRCRPGVVLHPRLLITPPLGAEFVLWTLVVQELDRPAVKLSDRIAELATLGPVREALHVAAGVHGVAFGVAARAAGAILRRVGRPDCLLSHSAYTFPGMAISPIELTGPEHGAAARVVITPEPTGEREG